MSIGGFVQGSTRLRRAARIWAALFLCVSLTSCENFERYAPEAASIFGAVLTTAAAVAAIQFAPEYYTEVNILMNTLTSSATAMVSTWSEYQQEEKALEELERLEAEIAAEQLAMDGGTSSSPGSGEGWGTAASADATSEVGSDWGSAAYSNPPPPDEPWGDQYRGVSSRSDARLAIDVTMARRAANGDVTALSDGNVLYDGRDGEHAAETLQIFVRPLQASYVYVIGVDAVGRVQLLYPVHSFEGQNFVERGQGLALPAADAGYGLDEYRGVQQIYFRVSRERDADLERQLRIFAEMEPPTPTKPDRVTEPTVIEGPALQSRGLTGIRETTNIRISKDLALEANRIAGSDELVATRYFDHR